MVNVFGDSVASGPGNLQVVKKVVVTKGKFKDYMDGIRQSYELGFTPYRLHTNVEGTFVTPIRVYSGKVYVLNDVATMEVSEWYLETDMISSKLIYFVKDNGGSGVALQGDRGPSGTRGLKGDSDDQGSVGSRGQPGKRGVEGAGCPPGKFGKLGPVRSKGDIGARGEKGDKGDSGQQGPIGPRGSTGPRSVEGAKGLRGVAGIQGPLGVQGPVGITGVQGERGPEGHYDTQGLVGEQDDRFEQGDRGELGERGIQGDTSDVLSVFVDHLPNQLATRYGEKMCFVKYQRIIRVS